MSEVLPVHDHENHHNEESVIHHKDGSETYNISISDEEAEKGEKINFEATFRFRKPSAERLAAGEEKRKEVKLILPYLTYEGLLKSLEDEKIAKYIVRIINGAIYEAAKEQVNDDTDPVNSQDELDTSKLTLEYLADVSSESSSSSSAITKEDWKEFQTDYIAVMTSAPFNKKPERVKLAAKHFVNKFAKVQTATKVLEVLRTLLDNWYLSKSVEGQEISEEQSRWEVIYTVLSNRLTVLLSVTEESMIEELVG